MSDGTTMAPAGADQSENALEFSLLGELRVTRGGVPLRLPPSRKTRALLAYLVLTGRAHRRERLCSMFWDVADDPRGALRWSLSKLRGLVDDEDTRRIEATRESVQFDPTACEVDVLSLRATLQGADLESLPIETLAEWAERFRGELLEGLDLPDFDDYQAWCVAEREQARTLRARILETLTRRLRDEPERALTHARAWVQVDPLNHGARLDLLKLAMAAGRREEAEQHYESGRRLLEELGSPHVAELIEAWRALKASPARSPSPAPARAPAPPPDASRLRRNTVSIEGIGLIGRPQEHAELVSTLERVERERGEHMLLITGEPGVGKSRLLSELRRLARERGATVLDAACYEGETGRPYGAFIDALRGLPRAGNDADGRSPLLAELDAVHDGEGGRDRLFAGVSDLLAVSAHDVPAVVLILDDAQWLDRASAELLHYVARTGKHRPVLVVLAARDEELSDNAALTRVLRSLRRDLPVSEIALGPLDGSAIAALVRAAGSEISTDRVFEQSGGNPLFALELARGSAGDDALPGSVADAVRDRLDGLPQQAADVLRWGAVLGCAFSVDRLEALMALDVGAVVDALEALERHALIRAQHSGEDYLFAHDVVRRVVYADLSEPRRVLMHRRVADNLQKEVDVDGSLVAEIAHHATLGHDDDLAASACARAGRRCLRIFANTQAMTLARRGLRHAEKLGDADRVRRMLELKEVELLAAPPQDLDATREELQTLADQALTLGLQEHARIAFYLLASLSWDHGDWDQAQRQVLQAEVATRGTEGKNRVQALADAGRCLVMLERDLPDAHAILLEAQARGRAADCEPGDVPDGLGLIELHRGKLDDAEGLFERARTLANAAQNRLLEFSTLEHMAMLYLERGDYAAVDELAVAMMELGDKLREGSEAPFARTLAGVAGYALQSEEGPLEAGLEELRMVDAKHRLAIALNQAALIELGRAEPERARARAEEAWPIARLLERPTEMLLALAVLARTACDLDDAEAYDRHIEAIEATDWSKIASAGARRRAEELLGRPLAAASSVEESR